MGDADGIASTVVDCNSEIGGTKTLHAPREDITCGKNTQGVCAQEHLGRERSRGHERLQGRVEGIIWILSALAGI